MRAERAVTCNQSRTLYHGMRIRAKIGGGFLCWYPATICAKYSCVPESEVGTLTLIFTVLLATSKGDCGGITGSLENPAPIEPSSAFLYGTGDPEYDGT